MNDDKIAGKGWIPSFWLNESVNWLNKYGCSLSLI